MPSPALPPSQLCDDLRRVLHRAVTAGHAAATGASVRGHQANQLLRGETVQVQPALVPAQLRAHLWPVRQHRTAIGQPTTATSADALTATFATSAVATFTVSPAAAATVRAPLAALAALAAATIALTAPTRAAAHAAAAEPSTATAAVAEVFLYDAKHKHPMCGGHTSD